MNEKNADEILTSILKGRFFDDLNAAISGDYLDAFLPWMKLLKSKYIEQWATSSKHVKRIISGLYPSGDPILRLLFSRHLLHLDTRRDPTALINFCNWSGLQLLEKHLECIADTLDQTGIFAQELAFTEFLRNLYLYSCEVLTNRHWMARELEKVVYLRSQPVHQSRVKVVFAFQHASEVLRAGLVVNFKLEGPNVYEFKMLENDAVFDDTFKDATARAQAFLGPYFNRLSHDAMHLPANFLKGGSGVFSFLIAQRLANPGNDFGRQQWALPTWAVMSAEIDDDGNAKPAGQMNQKATVLAEEGIRQFFIQKNSFLEEGGVHQDLKIERFSGRPFDLAKQLFNQHWLLEADLRDFDVQVAKTPPDKASQDQRVRELKEAVPKLNSFVRPIYAFEKLASAITNLNGKGYVWMSAPSGYGKSEFASSLQRADHHPEFKSKLGYVLTYRILRGEPSSEPRLIFGDLARQAERLDISNVLDIPRELPESNIQAIRRRIAQLLDKSRNVACRKNEPIILLIDGVDELESTNSLPVILDMLPLPSDLSPGCYVVLTSQTEITPAISSFRKKLELINSGCSFQHVFLSDTDTLYRAILSQYIVDQLGANATPLADQIIVKAKQSFRHVSLICHWLAMLQGDGYDLNPSTLDAISDVPWLFSKYLAQLRNDIGEIHFDNWHKQILMMIAASYEPIDYDCLALWLSDFQTDPCLLEHEINRSILSLHRLLRIENREWLKNKKQYVIADPDFQSWLLDNKDPHWGDSAYSTAVRKMIRNGQDLFSLEKLQLIADSGQFNVFNYHFWHLPTLMIEAGCAESAYLFLSQIRLDEIESHVVSMWRHPYLANQLIKYAQLRTCQFGKLYRFFSNKDGFAKEEVTCLRGQAKGLDWEIKSLLKKGQVSQALKQLEMQAHILQLDWLAPSNAQASWILEFHLSDSVNEYERREYFGFVIDSLLSKADVAHFLDRQKDVFESVTCAFAILETLKSTDRTLENRECFWFLSKMADLLELACDASLLTVNEWSQVYSYSGVVLSSLERVIDSEGFNRSVISDRRQLLRAFCAASITRVKLLCFFDANRDGLLCQMSHCESVRVLTEDEQANPLKVAAALCENLHSFIDEEQRSFFSTSSRARAFHASSDVMFLLGDVSKASNDLRYAIQAFEDSLMSESVLFTKDLLDCVKQLVQMEGYVSKSILGENLLLSVSIFLISVDSKITLPLLEESVSKRVLWLEKMLRVSGIFDAAGHEFQEMWSVLISRTEKYWV
jgi:hypothetical protein